MLILGFIYVLTLVLAWSKHRHILVNFLTFTNLIFIALVLPKIVYYYFSGRDAFIISFYLIGDDAAIVGVYVTFLFVIAINVAYLLARPYRIIPPSEVFQTLTNRQSSSIRLVSYFVLLPISLAMLLLYLVIVGVSLESIVAKRELESGATFGTTYIVQKLAQFSKVGFYLALLAMLCGNQTFKNWRVIFTVFFLLVMVVFLTSSQRSGAILVMIQISLVLMVLGNLKTRQIAIIGGAFVALNLVILSSRFVNGLEELSYFDIFVRRYFFELEKIAAIVRYSVDFSVLHNSPIMALLSTSTNEPPDGNVHYFVAEKMFGLYNIGIPPSLLGEIILYFGPVFVFPVTFIITSCLIRIERFGYQTPNAKWKLFCITVLSCSYFLLLNSDVKSLFNRIILEGVFYFAALNVFVLLRNKRFKRHSMNVPTAISTQLLK